MSDKNILRTLRRSQGNVKQQLTRRDKKRTINILENTSQPEPCALLYSAPTTTIKGRLVPLALHDFASESCFLFLVLNCFQTSQLFTLTVYFFYYFPLRTTLHCLLHVTLNMVLFVARFLNLSIIDTLDQTSLCYAL